MHCFNNKNVVPRCCCLVGRLPPRRCRHNLPQALCPPACMRVVINPCTLVQSWWGNSCNFCAATCRCEMCAPHDAAAAVAAAAHQQGVQFQTPTPRIPTRLLYCSGSGRERSGVRYHSHLRRPARLAVPDRQPAISDSSQYRRQSAAAP